MKKLIFSLLILFTAVSLNAQPFRTDTLLMHNNVVMFTAEFEFQTNPYFSVRNDGFVANVIYREKFTPTDSVLRQTTIRIFFSKTEYPTQYAEVFNQTIVNSLRPVVVDTINHYNIQEIRQYLY